jgi:hypothetical protein
MGAMGGSQDGPLAQPGAVERLERPRPTHVRRWHNDPQGHNMSVRRRERPQPHQICSLTAHCRGPERRAPQNLVPAHERNLVDFTPTPSRHTTFGVAVPVPWR